MSQSARSPGVLLSVRWGDQDLAREFLRLDAPRAFTIGSEPGCDFPCGGARAFKLIEIDQDGATLRQKDGTRTTLERGAPSQLALGALTFEAQLLDAPPQVRTGAIAELTTLNLALMMLAAFGFFAVAAANSDAEGAELDDELSDRAAKTIKAVFKNNRARQASAAEATPQKKEKPAPLASPNRQARQLPIARPIGRNTPVKVDVGALFRGPGAGAVFSSTGLGDALQVASTGMRTAEAGTGIGLMGSGHGMDGNGLGGMGRAGIGNLGTRGRSNGEKGYGVGPMLNAGPKMELPKPEEPTVTGCTVDGVGCIDKEMIRRVIRQNLAGFRYCYESLLNRYPSLEGKVSVRFQISQSGKVPISSVASSTAHNAELEQCVSDRTRLLQFPSGKWPGMVGVTYPFIFKQAGK